LKNQCYSIRLFSIVQTIDKLIHRSLAHHTEKHAKLDSKKLSVDEKDEKTGKNGVEAVIETKGAREAREKAKWERLSFVEKLVKKYLPSQINSIAIFVNNYL
jgi:hypothetical protein